MTAVDPLAAAVAELGALPMPAGTPLSESEQVSVEIARFGIYGAAVPATKALVKRADELVTENTALRARVAELDAVRTERDEARAELEKRPSRYRAAPAEVDWYLRKILTEDTLLNYQRAIGNRAVEEAAEEIRQETARLKAHGVLEPDKDWAAATAADWIDTSKDGGHYPSQLLCAKHDGFNPCPGAPRCTPREDEEAAR